MAVRTLNGISYEVLPSQTEWTVALHRLGNGHAEASVTRPLVWREIGPELRFTSGAFDVGSDLPCADQEDEAEKRGKALRAAANRAKTRVRRLVKVLGLDSLLTLTYRANQTDLALCKQHLSAFIKRMRDAMGCDVWENLVPRGGSMGPQRRLRRVPGVWPYVAAFEQQKRGAWHVHIACKALPKTLEARSGVKVKSYSVVRALWRRTVGDLDGNIDQARRKSATRHGPHKLAGYLSKYMLKGYEAWPEDMRRFQGSSAEIPKPERVTFVGAELADLIGLCYAYCAGPGVLTSPNLGPHKDRFFLVAWAGSEPPAS